jgi:hypothetical protein
MRAQLITCFIGLIALIPAAPEAHAQAAGASAVATEAGLRITISVPHRTYPRDALVEATLTVTNTYHHSIPLNGNNLPRVDDYASGHLPAYSPIMPFGRDTFAFTLGGDPRRPPVPLGAGKTIAQHFDVVLVGPHLEPYVFTDGLEITVPRLTLRLVPAPQPRVSIHTGKQLFAAIIAQAVHSGPLYVIQQSQCAADGGTSTLSTMTGWRRQRSYRIMPVFPSGCDSHGARRWELMAGRLDEPVVTARYSGVMR